MARKPRDYREEYKRRIANAAKRGLTRSQARGHARHGETPIRPKPAKIDQTLEDAIKAMRDGATLSAVAKRFHVGRERLAAYARTQAGASRHGRRWKFNDTRERRIPVIVAGKLHSVTIRVEGHGPAELAGQHYAEASAAVENPELFPPFIAKWEGKTIADTRGREYAFSTDPNQIFRAISAEEIDWSRIYHLYQN
jgi:hypothetical protein